MAAGTDPEAWQELCRIDIVDKDGTVYNFDGFTEDITGLEIGDKDIEGLPLVNGGRLVKITPEGDTTFTMKVYPVNVENESNRGVMQLFHPQSSILDSSPVVVDHSHRRDKYGIIFLWAETLPDDASTLPEEGNTAYRIQTINAYMTSAKLNYDDKILSAEVTFKVPPFNKDADPNIRHESTDGSTQLAAAITSNTSF